MTAKPDYVPQRGDAIWIDFALQTVHEQPGPRPAVLLSPESYNGKTRLAILCPITNQVNGYPFETAISTGVGVTGVILADQVMSMDWKARNATLISALPVDLLDAVLERVGTLLARE